MGACTPTVNVTWSAYVIPGYQGDQLQWSLPHHHWSNLPTSRLHGKHSCLGLHYWSPRQPWISNTLATSCLHLDYCSHWLQQCFSHCRCLPSDSHHFLGIIRKTVIQSCITLNIQTQQSRYAHNYTVLQHTVFHFWTGSWVCSTWFPWQHLIYFSGVCK